MTAEHYIQEKERLSQTLNGQDRLMEAVKSITAVLEKHNIDLMPGVAFDVMSFTLETIHLGKFDIPERKPFQY